MELYLIRHAQSLNNALPEEQRVEDPGLTELGLQQADCLGKWIGTLALTKVITSPFRRALETAKRIHTDSNSREGNKQQAAQAVLDLLGLSIDKKL